MQVDFTPELQAQLDKLATDAGHRTDELVREVMSDYVHQVAETRDMLDSRYDDMKSGKIKLIPGDQVLARLREKSADRRSQSS
jgi:hypothetical protein